jgi:hypothetical protein
MVCYLALFEIPVDPLHPDSLLKDRHNPAVVVLGGQFDWTVPEA